MFLYIIILFLYTVLILHLAIGILKINHLKRLEIISPKITFSIIIPFRNEGKNLPFLLNSISMLDYPIELFEVILVDDESNDNWQLDKDKWKFQTRLLQNNRKSASPKKDAIETAISHAKFNWIVATDADCVVPKNWLSVFNSAIEKSKPKMLIGSVLYQNRNTFLDHFQYNDLLSLQGVTVGSFGVQKGFMCNGANFAYDKELFKNLYGFEGNTNLASGDDVFLLQKALKKDAACIQYLGNQSVVYTNSCVSWGELIQQRVRWASKTSAYQSWYPKILGLIVFLTNFSLLISVINAFLDINAICQTLYFIVVKIGIDYIFLNYTSAYYQVKIKNYFTSCLLYPFLTTGVVILTFKGKYKWKGRELN